MATKEQKLESLPTVVERRAKNYLKKKSGESVPPEELRKARRLLKRAQRRRLKLRRGRKLSKKEREGS